MLHAEDKVSPGRRVPPGCGGGPGCGHPHHWTGGPGRPRSRWIPRSPAAPHRNARRLRARQ
eukprot:844516-Alexandrium_andersonii.AAC.1